jgi:hypothetical protein
MKKSLITPLALLFMLVSVGGCAKYASDDYVEEGENVVVEESAENSAPAVVLPEAVDEPEEETVDEHPFSETDEPVVDRSGPADPSLTETEEPDVVENEVEGRE